MFHTPVSGTTERRRLRDVHGRASVKIARFLMFGGASLRACSPVFEFSQASPPPQQPPPPVRQTHPFHMRRHRHGINKESRCWGCSLDINRPGRCCIFRLILGDRSDLKKKKKNEDQGNKSTQQLVPSVHHIIYVLCSPTSVRL